MQQGLEPRGGARGEGETHRAAGGLSAADGPHQLRVRQGVEELGSLRAGENTSGRTL